MFIRMINSFCYSIATTAVIYAVVKGVSGCVPMLPEYMAKFESDVAAMLVQLLLIGTMSAILAGGVIFMEFERLSLVAQSVLYFIITFIPWMMVGDFCWSVTHYKTALIIFALSYAATYFICWGIQYRVCSKNVEQINKRLEELENLKRSGELSE